MLRNKKSGETVEEKIVLWEGNAKFGNVIPNFAIPNEIKQIDIYIYANTTELHKYVYTLETVSNRSYRTGSFYSMNGGSFLEVEFNFGSNRTLKLDYFGVWSGFTGTVTKKENDPNFYVYKIVGHL